MGDDAKMDDEFIISNEQMPKLIMGVAVAKAVMVVLQEALGNQDFVAYLKASHETGVRRAGAYIALATGGGMDHMEELGRIIADIADLSGIEEGDIRLPPMRAEGITVELLEQAFKLTGEDDTWEEISFKSKAEAYEAWGKDNE